MTRDHLPDCALHPRHTGRCANVVHRLLAAGMAACGVREYEPGKTRARMSAIPKNVTCERCVELARANKAKAKAIGGVR